MGFSPTLYRVDPTLLPSGNPIKCHQEEVLSLQPMFPPKRFDTFLPLSCHSLGDAQKVWMPSDFSFNQADSYGNEKLIRKWTKSVVFIRDQKFGQADSYGNEKLIRKWTKSTGLGAF